MGLIINIITSIRNIRAEINIAPGKKVRIILNTAKTETAEKIKRHSSVITYLAKLENIKIGSGIKKPKDSIAGIAGEVEIFLPLEGLIDIELEKDRIKLEVEKIESDLEKTLKKLKDRSFLERAPEAVVANTKNREAELKSRLEKLHSNLNGLK